MLGARDPVRKWTDTALKGYIHRQEFNSKQKVNASIRIEKQYPYLVAGHATGNIPTTNAKNIGTAVGGSISTPCSFSLASIADRFRLLVL